MRRALLFLPIWLAVLVGGVSIAPRLASVAVTDPVDFFPADSEMRRASSALAELFPAAQSPSQIVVVLEAESLADARAIFPAERHRVRELAERLRAELPADAVTAVLSPTDDPVLEGRLVAADGRAALIVVRLGLGFASERASAVVAEAEHIVAARQLASGSGLRASFSGEATLGRDYLVAIEEGARRSGLATLALVAVTLLAVYRSPLAALISLVTLGVALGVAVGLVTLAAERGLPVAYQSRVFLVALLYGIGTDYCLLLFARVREEAAGDARLPDPVGAALRRSTPVIATSAAAVAVACALMALARFGLFRDSGPALAIGTAVVLAAILTLAPALMRLAGGALFWPGSLRGGRSTARLWRAIAARVIRSPVPVLVLAGLAVAPLVALGVRLQPSFELELDIPAASASERGWQALTRHFDPAAVSPLVAAIELPSGHDGSLRAIDGLDALYQLSGALAAEPGVGAVWSATQPTGSRDLLARATLASQLDELHSGLGRASTGARELAAGLGGAEGEVRAGQADLAARREALAAERKSSLLAALAPGRFDAADRDLETTGEKLEALETGIGRAVGGASGLADGVAVAAGRLEALRREPGAEHLLDHLALTAADVRALPELARALDHYVTRDGRAALFELRLESAPNSPAAVATSERLREAIPTLLRGFGLPDTTVWLGGATAITAELAAITRADLERLDVWILLGVFVLLVALLRGLAAPAVVTAFILASYFAALGTLQLLVGAGVWPGVDWKAPFFLFVLLVAIGADYGVFVLGRAREEARDLPSDAAIARALEATGPVVTSCGIVLAGTFATLLLARIAFLEQVGIGITIGVLIDTLIVRPFLLPAAAVLLARSGGVGRGSA